MPVESGILKKTTTKNLEDKEELREENKEEEGEKNEKNKNKEREVVTEGLEMIIVSEE